MWYESTAQVEEKNLSNCGKTRQDRIRNDNILEGEFG
jgi:hypothetical protein